MFLAPIQAELGSALLYNGCLVPNLELGHHMFRQRETYEEQLGKAALIQIGDVRWNQRVRKMIRSLRIAFNFDQLYISGGNAKHIRGRLPNQVRIMSNHYGLPLP